MSRATKQYECANEQCDYYGKPFDESELTKWVDDPNKFHVYPVFSAECPGCHCDLEEVE
jgi:hypothetical protein